MTMNIIVRHRQGKKKKRQKLGYRNKNKNNKMGGINEWGQHYLEGK